MDGILTKGSRTAWSVTCVLGVVAAFLGCDKATQGSDAPTASARAVNTPATVASTSAQAVASSASPAPPSPNEASRPRKRCVAAAGKTQVFLGRLMNFDGVMLGTDRLGLLTQGRSRPGKNQLRRLAIDPKEEPKLGEEPRHEILVNHAKSYLVNAQNIYYLTELSGGFPFNGHVMYLPAGEAPGQVPKELVKSAVLMLGEWEGWLYVLRLRDFNRDGLGKEQVEALIHREREGWNEASGTASGYGWRFSYDLLRVRPDGKLEELGKVPRSVDSYHNGYVYGRNFDVKSHELSVFRASVTGGEPQTIYKRKRSWGRGGVEDHLGRVNADADGLFFYEADRGVVTKMDHEGKNPVVLANHLAYYPYVETMGDYLFINGLPRLKKDGRLTYRGDSKHDFEKGSSGCYDYNEQARLDNFLFLWGRREYNGVMSLFSYELLPGGTVNAHRDDLPLGYWWTGMRADQDCVYHTASDNANTWYYAMPRALLSSSK